MLRAAPRSTTTGWTSSANSVSPQSLFAERPVQPPQRAKRAADGCNRKFDARVSRLSVEANRASTVKYRGDLNNVVAEAVDDSIVAVDDLADRLIVKLRYDAP